MRTQLRLSRALREGFASRRMTNADLASALNAIDDDSAIVSCLLDPQKQQSGVMIPGVEQFELPKLLDAAERKCVSARHDGNHGVMKIARPVSASKTS